jgi:two-component system NtrC family sensor kinase
MSLRGLGRSLQVRIVVGLLGILTAVMVWTAYHLNIHYEKRVAETVQDYSHYLSQTVENAFEFALSVHSMEGLKEGMSLLSDGTSVRQILLVNAENRVVMAAPEGLVGRTFGMSDEGCAVCHSVPVSGRTHATVVALEGSQVLRVAVPVRNQPQCHGCHDPARKVEGMVILDYALDRVQGSVSPGLMRMSLFFGVAAVGLVLGMGLMMNRMVVRRLNRLAGVARRIGEGRFQERADVKGSDEIAQLGEAFNQMAGNLGRFTERIEADRKSLDRLLNSMEDKIVVFDRDFKVVAANRAAGEAGLEGPPGETCEWVCELRDSICTANSGYCLVNETFSSGVPQRKVHTYHMDGAARTIEALTTPVREEGDEVSQVLFICRDITERRAMEAELIRSERLASLGRLAAGVAHEMNTPMASITACAEGLQRRIKGREGPVSGLEDLPEYLDTIRSAAYKARDIAGNLLNLSRKSGGDIQDVGPNDVIDEVATLVRPEADSQGVTLDLVLAEGLPTVSCDRERLGHALSNLVRNGLDEAGEGGVVRVVTEDGPGGVRIIVEDTGSGIAAEDLDMIFDPFFTTKPPGKGTGLGLSICERIIRDHGGSISAENSEGSGARFTVFLPALPDKGGA